MLKGLQFIIAGCFCTGVASLKFSNRRESFILVCFKMIIKHSDPVGSQRIVSLYTVKCNLTELTTRGSSLTSTVSGLLYMCMR